MAYQKQTWRNLPDRTTPITAERLEHLETQYDEAISEVDPSSIRSSLSLKADKTYVDDAIADVASSAGPSVNPSQFGVPDDGVGDATSAFQAMIAQLDDGVIIESIAGQKYKLDGTLSLNKPLTLKGGEFSAPDEGIAIRIEADDVTIDGITVRGGGNSSSVTPGHALVGSSGTTASPIERVRIVNCTLLNAPYIHMWLLWLKDFHIEENFIQAGQYAGIMLISPKQGIVRGNIVKDLYQAGSLVNSYGIAATDNSNTELGRAEDVLIEGNIVSGIPKWEGIDTHGGKNINIIGNTIKNCRSPIAVVTGNPTRKIAPEYCSVTGNYMERGSASSQTEAIVFSGGNDGGLGTRAASGTIGPNVIKGYTTDLRLAVYDRDLTNVSPQTFDGTDRRSPSQVPYRIWAATAALNVPSGNQGISRVIDFPPGYFTQPPVLSVTKAVSSGARHVPYYSEVTTSDVRIGLYDPSGSTSSANVTLSILAVQSGGTGNGTTYP